MSHLLDTVSRMGWKSDPRVAGERLDDLARALAFLHPEHRSDGTFSVQATLGPDVAPPLLRALMRIEAELLLHDADVVTAGQGELRTPGQRRADALVALALRVQDAATGPASESG